MVSTVVVLDETILSTLNVGPTRPVSSKTENETVYIKNGYNKLYLLALHCAILKLNCDQKRGSRFVEYFREYVKFS